MKKTLLLLFINFIITITTMAQSWQNIGTFLGPNARSSSITFSPSGVPYIAYRDNDALASVQSFDGYNWHPVGPLGFSINYADFVNIVFNPLNGVPYVAYNEYVSGTWKASVVSFNGINWDYVGNSRFSQGSAEYMKLAINSSGIPYVAYTDVANGYKATVMCLSGSTWATVGSAGFSSQPAFSFSLTFKNNSNIPYLAYGDGNENVYVLTSDGTNWNKMGGVDFSALPGANPSLVFSPSGVPYVAFSDGYSNQNYLGISVKSFSGSNWEYVGTQEFSVGIADYLDIAFSPSGVPYVALTDRGNNNYLSVLSFSGSTWNYVGGSAVSNLSAPNQLAIKFNPNGKPFLVYNATGAYIADFAIAQSITGFGALQDQTYGNVPITLSGVSASSGLTVSFVSSDPTIASIISNVISLVKAGTVTITSYQTGNGTYNGAAPLSQTLTIHKADQTISDFGTLPLQYFGESPAFFTISGVSASSGSPIDFSSSDAGIASITGNVITIMNTGTVTITASQIGNANFNASAIVSQVLTIINKTSQSITGISILPDITLSGTAFVTTLSGVAGSGLPISYSIVSIPADIATINGSQLTVSNIGTVTITAKQIGNDVYTAATSVIISFRVSTISGITSTITGPVTIISSINNPDVATVKLYPNPVKGILNISEITTRSNIELINSLGTVVYQQKSDADFSVDLSNYIPGLYLVKVTSGAKSKIFRIEKE